LEFVYVAHALPFVFWSAISLPASVAMIQTPIFLWIIIRIATTTAFLQLYPIRRKNAPPLYDQPLATFRSSIVMAAKGLRQ
jgi:hypothetical protein